MLAKWLILAAALSSSAMAATPTDPPLAAGIAQFNSAFQAWDAQQFSLAAQSLHAAEAKSPQPSLAATWHATALFHLALQQQSTANPAASQSLLAAESALEHALALNPNDPEAHALLASVLGMKIQGSTTRAIRFGPAALHHQKIASQLAPHNPRVLYLLGAAQFHTAKHPADFQKALATLTSAEAAFSQEAKLPTNPTSPRWGFSSCLCFIAQSHLALGNKPMAKSYFLKTLNLHPADHLARAGANRIPNP